jgi:alkanesulfonate monooxygenase SsuD/methylene tetrahydromethanopterin reductase-like flavin-dependent oxidoreductase (luciferase family)
MEVAVRFGAAFWVNRTSWADLRDACLAVEAAGWDSLWIDDHLLADGRPSSEGEAQSLSITCLTTV